MSNAGPSTLEPVLVRLSKLNPLSAEDLEALGSLPMSIRDCPADQDLLREGEGTAHCFVVLEGLTCRYRVVSDGRRQILGFGVPGELPGLLSLHLPVMDHNLATLVPTRIGLFAHAQVRELCERRPQIAAALWRETLIDGAVSRAWLIGIGRMPARARLAHLFCELHLRLGTMGPAEEFRYDLPLTQQELADALGLSVVHVNRILRDLKLEGVIAVARRVVTICDWSALQAIGQFDPTYLYLTPPEPRG